MSIADFSFEPDFTHKNQLAAVSPSASSSMPFTVSSTIPSTESSAVSSIVTSRAISRLLSRVLSSLAAVLVVAVVLAGCSGPGGQMPANSVIPAPTTAITLVEDLRLGVENPLFGSVSSVAADPSGIIYVADRTDEASVYKFAADGTHLGYIGSFGEGPGEYQSASPILAFDDSLAIYDARRDVMHIYESDGTFRRSVGQIEAPDLTSVSIISGMRGKYFARQAGVYYTRMNPDEVAGTVFRVMDGNGTLGDTLWVSPPSETMVHVTENTISVSSQPYGRRSLCAAGGEVLYCAWSDDLVFLGFTAEGDSVEALTVEYNPLPVTPYERREATERVSDIFQDQLNIPDTKPALEGLVVDDRGRLWAKVRLTPDDEVTTFWIIDPSDRSVTSATVDANVSVRLVRDGFVYAVLSSPDGEQFVVRYRIEA